MMLLKVLKNKKGIVMETAIIFMVSIFSFCFLLSGLTIGAHYRAKAESVKLEQQLLDEMIPGRILDEYRVFLNTIEVPAATGQGDQSQAEGETPEEDSIMSFQQYILEKPEKFLFVSNAYIINEAHTFDKETGLATFYLKIVKNNVTLLEKAFTKTGNNPPSEINITIQ